jgi:DhnA family fructose-bisphosphate aldolase class Ia
MSSRSLSRIVAPDGRSVILALDAYAFNGSDPGIDETAALVPQMAEVGLDCVLVSKGLARRSAVSLQKVGMVLRCDSATSPFESSLPASFVVNDALDAVRVGADGVVVMSFPGQADHERLQLQTVELYRGCREYGLPLVIEALPFSFLGSEASHRDPKNVGAAVRLAVEFGADVVKTRFSGEEGDELITAGANVPVVALGGPKAELEGYLNFVRNCVDRGAAGVAVGRNVREDPYPVAKVSALVALVHGDASVAEALDIYRDLAR